MLPRPGFPPAAVPFYRDLEENNTREWWLAHRATYEGAVRGPMEALADALADEFGEAKIFRPQRDLRFSRDKTPYKTHQGAAVMRGTGIGYYVQIDADGLMTAAGMFGPQPDQLRRFRAAVLDDIEGRRLASEVANLVIAQSPELGGELMKTHPRGVTFGHPRYELLRHKALVFSCFHGTPDWLATPSVVEKVRSDWRMFTPLVTWFERNVGTSERPPRR